MRDVAEGAPAEAGLPPLPVSALLANGRHLVLVTDRGTGFSSLGDEALTAWQADPVEDPDGYFLYIRDLDDLSLWSAGWMPVPGSPLRYEARRIPGGFEIVREERGIESRLTIAVPPGAPVEIRRLALLNRSGRRRRLDVTSFARAVLQRAAAHDAHPVFSGLFVETEFVPSPEALLARRRSRGPEERHPWLVHAAFGGGSAGFETDRARFLGRGRGERAPRALATATPLSGTSGNVLDPALSLRREVDLEPGGRAEVTFLLGAGDSRDAALEIVSRLPDPGSVGEALRRAEARDRELHGRLGIGAARAAWDESLAAAALKGDPALRAPAAALGRARGSPDALSRLGLPPERAFALLVSPGAEPSARTSWLFETWSHWRALGIPIDLVVVDGAGGARAPAERAAPGAGPIRIAPRDLRPGELDLLQAAARLVVGGGSKDRTRASLETGRDASARASAATAATANGPAGSVPEEELLFFNGYGGFAPDGREYVIRLPREADGSRRLPPRPWINVIANDAFGFLISETGAGYTWHGNSREHRLTPWYNDPVLDPHGEAFYVRDEESGEVWSALPGPIPGPGDYEMRHAFGGSRCRYRSGDLDLETVLFVPRSDPLRVADLRLTNRSGRDRRISLFAYYRLVMGPDAPASARFVVTRAGAGPGTVVARSALAGALEDQAVFAAIVSDPGEVSVHLTCDRMSFLGAHGSPARPAALLRPGPLDGRTGAGLDPCIAQQAVLSIPAGASVRVSFLFGEADREDGVEPLLRRYAGPDDVERTYRDTLEAWKARLSVLRIETPSPALDLLVNGWLPYQILACRIQARSAFYQSGGAFGFRDQLQDAAALQLVDPERTRRQILLHAAHQFEEGDVLHWWHPPEARGTRTRCVDDLVWLPAVTARYVQGTGDHAILEERIPFRSARLLAPGEDEAYLATAESRRSATLYEHCVLALDRSLARGARGLPFFGTGDWNDGMNRVGREGRGESVWMGFFLHRVLGDFRPICEARGDDARARRYAIVRGELEAALNDAGWDGEWYRRGWYDDGTPLGSRESDECRIDALAQAWSVLSGAAPPDRAARAMDAVEAHLISDRDGLIRLLDPPFEKGAHDPGYIRGYAPGVRENGGQYTHAAVWVAEAMAALGRDDRAVRLLDLLNPISHAGAPDRVEVYQVEPYVVAADVYGAPPHVGRGGWTWYTGSAGWMYRIAVETILGIALVDGKAFRIRPHFADGWDRCRVVYRVPGGEAEYEITLESPERRPGPVRGATLNGRPLAVEDGAAIVPVPGGPGPHRIVVVLGPGTARPS